MFPFITSMWSNSSFSLSLPPPLPDFLNFLPWLWEGDGWLGGGGGGGRIERIAGRQRLTCSFATLSSLLYTFTLCTHAMEPTFLFQLILLVTAAHLSFLTLSALPPICWLCGCPSLDCTKEKVIKQINDQGRILLFFWGHETGKGAFITTWPLKSCDCYDCTQNTQKSSQIVSLSFVCSLFSTRHASRSFLEGKKWRKRRGLHLFTCIQVHQGTGCMPCTLQI